MSFPFKTCTCSLTITKLHCISGRSHIVRKYRVAGHLQGLSCSDYLDIIQATMPERYDISRALVIFLKSLICNTCTRIYDKMCCSSSCFALAFLSVDIFHGFDSQTLLKYSSALVGRKEGNLSFHSPGTSHPPCAVESTYAAITDLEIASRWSSGIPGCWMIGTQEALN